MKSQKSGFLKNCGYISIIASALLIMSILVAGCTQSSSDNSGQSAAVSSPTDTSGNSAPVQNAVSASPAGAGQQGTRASPSGTYQAGQHAGGSFLTNETRLAAAAQTLGVSESDLKNALTPPAQGRVNLTDAAAQLSASSGTTITSAQLMAAFGMHAGGPRNGSYQGNGQNTATPGGSPQSGSTASGP
jgi:hypothetical protein